MNILIDVYLRHQKGFTVDETELVCPTGEVYQIYEIDDDELAEWNSDESDANTLLLTIYAPANIITYTTKGWGELVDGEIFNYIRAVEISSCDVPGIDCTWYDPSLICGNAKAEREIMSRLEKNNATT